MSTSSRSGAALAATAALKLAGTSTWKLGRVGRRFPPPVIREIVTRLAADSTLLAIFVRQVVLEGAPGIPAGDERLAARWTKALDALLDLDTTYAWGSKERRAKLAAIARDPELLAAVQAVAVGGEASLDMLAVLAIDGSEASADALLPVFTRAAKEGSSPDGEWRKGYLLAGLACAALLLHGGLTYRDYFQRWAPQASSRPRSFSFTSA